MRKQKHTDNFKLGKEFGLNEITMRFHYDYYSSASSITKLELIMISAYYIIVMKNQLIEIQ